MLVFTPEEQRKLRQAIRNLKDAFGTWACLAEAMGMSHTVLMTSIGGRHHGPLSGDRHPGHAGERLDPERAAWGSRPGGAVPRVRPDQAEGGVMLLGKQRTRVRRALAELVEAHQRAEPRRPPRNAFLSSTLPLLINDIAHPEIRIALSLPVPASRGNNGVSNLLPTGSTRRSIGRIGNGSRRTGAIVLVCPAAVTASSHGQRGSCERLSRL
jgi:hypothetical protein